jgi:hypothetical protein
MQLLHHPDLLPVRGVRPVSDKSQLAIRAITDALQARSEGDDEAAAAAWRRHDHLMSKPREGQ